MKNPFISIKNKTMSWIRNNPEEVAYYVGGAVATVGCIIGFKIAENISNRYNSILWDEQEAIAQENYGDQRHIVLRGRNKDFHTFVATEE